MKKIVQVFTVSMSVRFLEGLAKQLSDAGYKLIVVCADGNEARIGEKNGEFEFYPIDMARGISPIKNIKAWFDMFVLFKKIKPDIVHGNTPIGGLLAMSVAKVLKIKNRVYTLHGLKYPGERGIKRIIVKAMEKISLMLSNKSFAVSNGLRDFAVQEGMVDSSTLSVLNNGSVKGIDIEQSAVVRNNGRIYYEDLLSLSHRKFRIGYFGRINEEKGVCDLINAINDIDGLINDLEVLLCGPLEMSNIENTNMFESFSKRDNVLFCGMVDNSLQYMMCCDIIVLPTYREGFGLVNIEANSVGVPVVTTNIMGCKDSIEDSVTGLFFEVGNSKDLANKILYLYENDVVRNNMGKNGIERANKMFNRCDIWNELIKEYNSFYNNVD